MCPDEFFSAVFLFPVSLQGVNLPESGSSHGIAAYKLSFAKVHWCTSVSDGTYVQLSILMIVKVRQLANEDWEYSLLLDREN